MMNVRVDEYQWILTKPDKRRGYEAIGHYPTLAELLYDARKRFMRGKVSKKTLPLLEAIDIHAAQEAQAKALCVRLADEAVEAAKTYLANTQLLSREGIIKKRRKIG